MTGMVRFLRFWLLLLVAVAAPGLARAADVRVQGSTQYLWYTDPFDDKKEGDVVQYVKVGAAKLDQAGRFSMAGYGRLSKQFGSNEEILPGDNKDVLGRLYFLYANYALPENRGDIRLGRQFVSVGAGSGTVDGVRFDVRNLGPLAVSAFWGYDVRFAESSDFTRSNNYLAGISAGGSFFQGNNIEISYLRKYDRSDAVREMAGLHADQRISKFNAYVDLRYDLINEAYSEFLAGVKAFPYTPVTVTVEYFSSYPQFDADTIYSVFAVTRYREGTVRADWIATPELTLFASYARADYDGPTADVGTLGLRARPKAVPNLGISASGDLRHGYPGNLDGFRLSADYAVGKLILAGGISYDSFQRDSMADGFSAKKYWAGASYAVLRNLNARVRLEDAVTRQFENEYQGRASLDYSF